MIAGLLAAVGGLMTAGMNGSVAPGMADTYLLPSIAAAVLGGTSVLGGTGGFGGTIVAVLILTVLDRLLLSLNISQALQYVVYGLIVLALAVAYTRLTRARAGG